MDTLDSPQTNSTHAMGKVTILGHEFPFLLRYFPGVPVIPTEGEASAFNAILAENLRNNFSSRIRAKRDELGLTSDDPLPDDVLAFLQADFAEYQSIYSFASGKRKVSVDPISALAEKLAREAISSALRRRGQSFKDYTESWLEEKTALILERNPHLREEAARRISAARVVAETTFDLD